MNKTLATIFTALTVLGNGLTAFAAPEVMTDGTVFDAEYYAQNNPDVIAELGTDRDVLYNHYITFGKNEGRLPYEPGTAQAVKDFAPTMKQAAGTTPAEVLVFFEFLGTRYPEFMLTDSHPIKAEHWAWTSNGFGSRPTYISTYSYDNEGNLVSVFNDGADPIYVYDSQGRVIQSGWSGIGLADCKYDEQGRIKKIEQKLNIKGVIEDVDSFDLKYDDSGLLISIDWSYNNGKAEYGHDMQGKLIWISSNDDYWNYDYDYDEFGRLIKKKHGSEEIIYSYDEQGKMINKIKYYDGRPSERAEYIYE